MLEINPVRKEEKSILLNLLQKYNYEFSQWDWTDVNDLGLYGYDWLDAYWTEPCRWAYFFRVDGKLAGFAMVNNYPEDKASPMDYSMAQFCILPKYRRCGIGREAAARVFAMHRGRWQLKRHPHNTASVFFWDRVCEECGGSTFRKVSGHPDIVYDDGTHADLLYFEN